MPMIITTEDVLPGDVLVFFSQAALDNFISAGNTHRFFCHAAICVGNNEIAHCHTAGVEIDNLLSIMATYEYDYVAVKRQEHIWCDSSIIALEKFATDMVCDSIFNYQGLRDLSEKEIEHSNELYNKLENYFKNPNNFPVLKGNTFFCAEFVVWAYYAAGLLHPSMLVHESPDAKTTDSIAQDMGTYGEFKGYIKRWESTQIHSDDPFYRHVRFL